MDKPVTVVREELRETVTQAINKSGLPAFVVADMFERFLAELRQIEKQQYEDDLRKYNSQEGVEQ